MKRTRRLMLSALVATAVLCLVAYLATGPHVAPLTAAERPLVGRWAYISPNHQAKTVIVYHFAADRRVRKEHYHLTSASPTVPRITMVGKWSVDKDGRLSVEPDTGLSYVRDSISGWLNEYFDNGRQAWAKPILTRSYRIRSVTRSGIQVDYGLDGGGQISVAMLPFTGDPTAVRFP